MRSGVRLDLQTKRKTTEVQSCPQALEVGLDETDFEWNVHESGLYPHMHGKYIEKVRA